MTLTEWVAIHVLDGVLVNATKWVIKATLTSQLSVAANLHTSHWTASIVLTPDLEHLSYILSAFNFYLSDVHCCGTIYCLRSMNNAAELLFLFEGHIIEKQF